MHIDDTWQQPPNELTLVVGDVHVWRVVFERFTARQDSFLSVLNEDERERADRFHFESGRSQYVVTRAALRMTLSRYTGIEAQSLEFEYSTHGKPSLKGDGPPQFNVAHSGGLALIAVTKEGLIGVDVEARRRDFAGQRIANRFFSAREAGALRNLPTDQQEQGFLNCWTRKEAYIKARGEGLSCPLDSFDVTLAPGEPARLLNVKGDPNEAANWNLCALPMDDGIAAAVALRGPLENVCCWDWTDST
ncbi:MAG: 4'-phosphopantetheinyl transferase superfamily protein [Candidatus Hydrogenedentes bacterium]|nr:4'-phosphopantetheinyl transferase superfamily protein [Candidatus Hydrogenedentota bacterium]